MLIIPVESVFILLERRPGVEIARLGDGAENDAARETCEA